MPNLISLNPAKTVLSASTTSASGAVAMDCPTTVRVTNDGSMVAYVCSDVTAPTATSANTPIMPGATEMFSFNPQHKYVAAIMASGTANVTFCFSVGGE